MSIRKKANIGYEKDNSDIYYYSSDDSEDEQDRAARKSRLNTIQPNFTQTYLNSPIHRNSSINVSISNEENKFTQINFTKFVKRRSTSNIRIIKINHQQTPSKKSNFLSFFTYNYNRDDYLEIKANNNYSQSKNDSHNRINWKLFYDTIFKNKNAQNKNNINLEIENNNIEKYRFDILIDKIKNRIKKKYELIKDEDMDNNENSIKKINILPEILSNLKKNEDNLGKIYKIGISEKDKNKFLPLFINKLQNKFNTYLNKSKNDKRKYLNSNSNSPFNLDKHNNKNNNIGKYSQKKINKIKKIKFENVDKKFLPKLSIAEDKLESHLKNNFNNNNNDNFIRKTKTRITNLSLDKKKLFNNNKNGLINSLNKRRKLNFTRKSVMKKKIISSTNLSPKNGVVFSKSELNNIDNQNAYITDDIFEQFKNNSKIIINDEILFKELKKQYPNYEEEIFNLYNNFLLFEKIYDRQGLRNYMNKKHYKDYNHSINNFLTTNKIKFLLSDKYEISNKILENCKNCQTIINYLNN